MNTVRNNFLEITAKTFGAELTSIKSSKTGKEHLYQADTVIWPRHAPVLFPIVGKLREGKYTYQGKIYTLPQHGFGRDMDFSLADINANSLIYSLESTEETLAKYPFAFEFLITYRLENERLITAYNVKNKGNTPMYFSVGAHPAFNILTSDAIKFEDYFIELSTKETVGRYLILDGLLTKESVPLLENDAIIPISTALFASDAIVLKHLRSKSMAIKCRKSDFEVKIDFEGFPYFGIWTKPNTNKFICLEPWLGIADSVDAVGELTEKEGIMQLPAGASFETSFSLSFT